MSLSAVRKSDTYNHLFIKRLKAELTEIMWSIVVNHWQHHSNLTISELQQCYNSHDPIKNDDHFLKTSFLSRIQQQPIAEAITISKIDVDELIQTIKNTMFENICFFDTYNQLTTTDIMWRRSLMKSILKDKIAIFLLPPYDTSYNVSASSNRQKAVTNVKEDVVPTEKTKKGEKEVEKDKTKNTKKDIVKGIASEIALENEKKKRFNSEEYADLRDFLNIP